MIPTLNLGIVLDQGADFSLVIGISDESGAVDLTDYHFLSEMRATTDPTSDPIAEFTFDILDQTTNKGQVKWSLAAATDEEIATSIATALSSCRQTTPFLFDVKMKNDIGAISRIIQGIIYVSPEATQENFT